MEDRNFNTIICEKRDQNGEVRVLYKAAREEIGTRYSIDGSYWENSKTYTEDFLQKVKACYQKTIPYQRKNNSENVEQLNQDKTIKMPVLGKLGQLMKRYNSKLEKCISPIAKI